MNLVNVKEYLETPEEERLEMFKSMENYCGEEPEDLPDDPALKKFLTKSKDYSSRKSMKQESSQCCQCPVLDIINLTLCIVWMILLFISIIKDKKNS